MRWTSRIVAASGLVLFVSCSSGGDDARTEDDTGRLIVQSSEDVMEALFEGTLVVASDGCTSVFDGQALDVIWPLGTRWDQAEQAVVLADGTRLLDGTSFRTGGGVIPLPAEEMQSAVEAGWLEASTVTDETVACLVNDEVLVIGDFETVIDR